MAGPPCKCTSCGFVFSTTLIEIGPNVANITFENCAVSCPKCGGIARVGDGTYTSIGEAISLLAGPSSTKSLIDELSRIAHHARKKKLTAQEVLAEIADVSPDLAAKLGGIGPWPVVGLALLLFWIVKSVTLDLKVDFNWLIDQAWHISHGQDPEHHFESSPPLFPHDSEPQPTKPLTGAPILASVNSSMTNRHARRKAASLARRKKHFR